MMRPSLRPATGRVLALAGLIGSLALSACGGDATRAPVPTDLEIVDGDGQTATVNAAVAIAPSVRILDDGGKPMVGQTVVFAAVGGSGTVTGGSATTDAQGVARVGAWTLGTVAGAQTLQAKSGSLAPVTFSASAKAGAASAVTSLAGDGQTSRVSSAVATKPSVRVADAFGNPVSGLRVTFAAGQGGGHVTGATPNTDATGTATVGGWQLGNMAGTQTLQASVAGVAPVTFQATAQPGEATTVVAAAGAAQSSVVGGPVAVRPRARVTDSWGNGLQGHMVTFTVTGGGGSISGAQVTTGADGSAEVGSWTLGTAAGPNTLVASSPGLAPATFEASAVAGPPAALTVSAGDNQSAAAGAEVAVRPAVVVRDQFGNPVSQANVVFAVASGGGNVSGANQFTDPLGSARVGAWTLGPDAGTNTLTATVNGIPALTFTATGTTEAGGGGGGSFSITVRYLSNATVAQHAAVNAAVARWEQVITGDLSDVQITLTDVCGVSGNNLNEVVDDVVVYVDFGVIDGAGGTLGTAGPCLIRNSNSLPAAGILILDGADLQSMEVNGTLGDVVLHEIGHVLGIGSMWSNFGLLSSPVSSATPSNLPYFTGAAARAAFDAGGGITHTGNKVPVENTGGAGTWNGHWRESVMRNELMTGFISGTSNPLSFITVMSLQDLGYTVDGAAADSYTVTNPVRAAGSAEELMKLQEVPLPFAPKRIDDSKPVRRR